MNHNRNLKFGRPLAAILIVCILATGLLAAKSAQELLIVDAELSPQFTITVDGVNRNFYNVNGQQVHPILFNGTTYLPVRAIGELMGKNVNWDEATLTVDIAGSRTTPATVGTEDKAAQKQTISAELRKDFKINVDGVQKRFADANGNVVYPMLYNGSTYLPIRAIGNLMGKNVSWDGSTETVSLHGKLDTSAGTVTDADTFNPTTPVTPTADPTTGTSNPLTPVQPGTTVPSAAISAEQAKSIALKHAGVDAASAAFVRVNLDFEDRRLVYEVEFYVGNKEYDYEIDANSGVIVSFDYDAEFYSPGAGSMPVSGKAITLEEAKNIALSNVPGATAANIVSAKMDYDDGRKSYDVKIIVGTTKYEFEFDAATGTITEKDFSSIYD